MIKDIQAKDLPDREILRVVWGISMGTLDRAYDPILDPGPETWAFRWDIEKHLPAAPPKVLRAKLGKLVKRGLLEGCGLCDCRGDFYLTAEGRAMLGVQ